MTFKQLNIKSFTNRATTFSAPFLSGRVGLGVLFFFVFQFSFAQKKEQIGTETVNVVKPYTPKISDAFKVKEIPELDEEGNAKKETIKYTIFSFPVASTFTPSKGKAEGVEKEKQAHLFKNYATFGVGNYGTFIGELFVNHDINNTDYVGGMFRHHSSEGGIQNVALEDGFYDTSLDLMYGSNQKDVSWNLDLGYQNQIYNWYGLPENFGSTLTPQDRVTLINGINPQQTYGTISLGGNVAFNESILNKASLKYNHFSDASGSSENRFYAKPTVEFDVMESAVKTNIIVDYVGGSFKKNYSNTNTERVKYGFTNFGIAPSFVMQEDDWTLNIGAGLFYSLDNVNSNNKFLVYPQFNASYKVVGDLMIFYAGAEGNLEQNSYMDFVNENPFLSPTLNIAPTDKQYDVFAGLKGKLTNNVSYNVKASYANERNKALFRSNDYNENATNDDYAFGNSLQVVYDDMKTLSFYGELKADFSEDVTFGINGTFSSFTNDFQQEAWNLPTIKLNSNLDFNITEKWFAGTNVFYVGERKDFQMNTDFSANAAPVTLKSYFDVNANLGYKYSDRLTAFVRANNITNNAYQKWLNYPVQGFQVILGANYKFGF
ncbi:TonB-dependent receptor [Flavobacterium sinopsychrotolerans]|uniref:TonB dependent receptor n=1 Tax=Flavobacterium sinopsychrotolerans TaxID=604089 RepID=A0A1H8HLI8_9FLAO|nr:TonB-dependent receptor [Flavobacterium sinopsychrotolerans]SEN56924.1 TonB dependent receptor [Flavobacterium sinopsychrotolerans]